MAQNETSAVNGDGTVQEEDDTNEDGGGSTIDNGGGESETAKQADEEMPDDNQSESKADDQVGSREASPLPIIIDDLAELGVEWMVTKNEEGIANWNKEGDAAENFQIADDGQLEVEAPPPMPDVTLSSHGQMMHLVPPKDDGRTSTTLTWIRKTALRKDSASDRRITVRGLSLGDLFHPRIYTLIQMAQSVDYSSSERTVCNSCHSGILTINFRTVLDRVVAMRRYLLDMEIRGRNLEIVCTFPDHKRPPDFETLWKVYEIEGVPPCSSQRADREILAKQIVVKNVPASCNEEEIRKYFGSSCDEVEFVEDYKNSNCAIVTFVDAISCHFAHARQNDLQFEDGTRPEVYLMTEMAANSKLMPKKAKEESEEERYLRHSFEILWGHQQKVANASHVQERYGRAGDYGLRKTAQHLARKLPHDVKERLEARAIERKEKEKEAAEKDEGVAAQEVLIEQPPAKSEHEQKSATEEKTPVKATVGESAPVKRHFETTPDDYSAKRPKKKSFRGGGASVGMQRRGGFSTGDGYARREQIAYQMYQRAENNRGYNMPPLRRGGGPPSVASPPGRYAGRGGGGAGAGGYPGEMRASPWLVPPGGGGASSGSFDRHMDMAGGYGSSAGLMARRELQPPYEQGGPFGSPGGLPYTGQVGYMTREMEMQRSGGGGGGGDLYQRRDAMGPDFQRTDYRGFYGKH